MMDRRTFIKAAGAAVSGTSLAAPALAQSARSRTLLFVPLTPLSVLDPMIGTNDGTIQHGYHIFDTLYSIDSKFQPQPQMADGHTVSDDGLTWTFRLRPGLKFTDGEPVRAKDCVASLNRWAKRDAYGSTMYGYSDAVEVVDDQSFRIRLKKRFPVLDALAHPHSSPALIMPERIAMTDSSKPITEFVGSGPYRFVDNEYVAGQKAIYVRNDAYVPRSEKADALAGGKIAHFERIEWRTIGDSQTAAAALITGEVDWVQGIGADLVPLLKREPSVRVDAYDPYGQITNIRFNMVQPPFNNAKIRRLVLEAMTQEDYNRALMGDLLEAQKTCYTFFHCALPGVQQVAEKLMSGKKDYPRLAEEVKKAGYNGEKVAIMSTPDVPIIAPFGPILNDVLKKLGMNSEVQVNDYGTFLQRRNSREIVEKGGWSAYHSAGGLASRSDPILNLQIRGLGDKGFVGWFDSPPVEALVAEWIAAPTPEARSETLNKLQLLLLEQVPMVPMGLVIQQTGLRRELTGLLPSLIAVPWNLKRA